jgi:hypothetical protein
MATAADLTLELYYLWKTGRLGYSTSARERRDEILRQFADMPRWEGKTTRTLDVPGHAGDVLILTQMLDQLYWSFSWREDGTTLTVAGIEPETTADILKLDYIYVIDREVA